MTVDGFTAPDTEVTEAVEAVRSVLVETLERAAKNLAEGERIPWSVLADAGLLALVVPEEHGGEGLGLDALAVLLRETAARAVARAVQLPVLETLCCGVLTLAAHGSDEQQAALLPGVATGDVVLTPAVREVGRRLDEAPQTTYADGAVTGRKIGVSYAADAARLLVTATQGDQQVVALVDVSDPGVTLLESGSSSGLTTHTVVLDGASAELLARNDEQGGAHRTLTERYVVGLCLTAAGVVVGARDLTADYIKGRTQFGRSLAQFQAVAMQIADVYIASRTLDLAAENAAWRVAERAGRDRRPRRGGVLDLHRGPARAAHLPPPARRHGRRRDLPAVPLLLLGHRHRRTPSTCRPRRSRSRTRPPRTSSSPRRSARSRRRSGRTSPGWPTTTSTARWAWTGTARSTSGSCGRWAPTAGWASAGPRSTAATGSVRSSRRSSPTRPSTPTCTSPRSRCRPSARR